jgi:hypothetical protein
VTGCHSCAGFGGHHDPTVHDEGRETCEHDWMELGGPGDEYRECWLCGLQEDA